MPGATLLVSCLLLPSIGFGLDGRPLPFDTVLVGVTGKPLKDADGPLTLKGAATNALVVTLESDKNSLGPDKFRRWELARRINENPKILVKTEEISIIKERIGIAYGPDVVGPSWELIEDIHPDKK